MLDGVTRQHGVLAALLVEEHDGIVIDAALQYGVDGEVIAALAASLYRRSRRAAAAAGLGSVRFVALESEHGRLCAAGRDGLVLIALAGKHANAALLRSALLYAAESLV